jgi:hypothetical protein
MYQRSPILFARANSKLCFLLQKCLFAAENQLAPDLMSGGWIASKVGNPCKNVKSNGYGR